MSNVIKVQRKAVLIGINYYNSKYVLEGCINDCYNIKKQLITKQGYRETEILCLCDDGSTKLVPTRKNIMDAIQWLTLNAKKGDRLLFSYCGHGGQKKDYNNDETDGLDETICPTDFISQGQITDDVLRSVLVDRIPLGTKLTCIFDSCHSGSILDLKFCMVAPISMVNGAKTFQMYNNCYQFSIDRLAKMCSGDVICISGCRDDQTSADIKVNGKGSGAMTWALITVLLQIPQKLTYDRLLYEMRIMLQKSGYSQIPQISFGKPTLLYETVSL